VCARNPGWVCLDLAINDRQEEINCEKGVIIGENFGALMILYSEIGGHALTPILDTYLWTRIRGLMKYRSAGERVVIKGVTDGD